jgi:hypothetical protein
MAREILGLLTEPVGSLCFQLLRDLPQQAPLTEEEQDELELAKRRMAMLWLPSPDGDRSGRKGYQWPASRLTAEDMAKLHRMRLETRKPITVLLHEAVSVLYELTQSDMQKIAELRERTGKTIRQLLHEAVEHLWDTQPEKPTPSSSHVSRSSALAGPLANRAECGERKPSSM